jgi:hypothetical protein
MPSEEIGSDKNQDPPVRATDPVAEAGTVGKDTATPPPPARRSRSWVAAIVSGLAVGVAVALAFVTYDHSFSPAPPPAENEAPLASTEARFQDSIADASSTTDLVNEWRAARSDHKIIAYNIARCLKLDVFSMSPDFYSMLMLDLRPNGDHSWRHSPLSRRQAMELQTQSPVLAKYPAAMLALSDAVSRARISAAAGAGGFYPQMWWFGWISVLVSALATMVVTLRASMGATAGWLPRVASIFAILLSTAATVLTGAKQFWDPTNAYMRNETALLALKQLHQEIVLTFVETWDTSKCQLDDSDDAAGKINFPQWRKTLVSLQIGTMPAPVIVPNQTGTGDQRAVPNEAPNWKERGQGTTTTASAGVSGTQQSSQQPPRTTEPK